VSDAERHTSTLILGGGFGGIAVADGLRRALGEGHEILLVDRAPRFSMGLRKLWELVGHAPIAEGSRPRKQLAGGGTEFLQAEITAIKPRERSAETDAGTLRGERLVIALGARPRPDLVTGLAEHGHDVWAAANIPGAARALEGFGGGRIVILVAGAPYPCPPAPYECAFLLDEHLRERGLREQCEILVATVQPMLMPNAGRAGSEFMSAMLDERGIAHRAKVSVARVESGAVVLDDGEILFDLLLAVPPHRAPEPLAASGLLGPSGWIEVDPGTLETGVAGVYAVGDNTMIRLANGLPMPKAGLVAELEGERVAAAIAAEESGAPAAKAFDGRGECFIEVGVDKAAMFRGRFYEEPAPVIEVHPPDSSHAVEKRRFEASRLARWFGA
jgi:sulfide:quinone oxidoreductase